MENADINSDPQQYREEWFDVAISHAKEFQLPNLSPPRENANNFGMNTNSVRSTWPASFVENCQVTATSRSQTQVQIFDSLPSYNNVGEVDFTVENKQACVHDLSDSSPSFYPTGFLNLCKNNPWSSPNQNPTRNLYLSNIDEATTYIISKPPHDPGWSGTSSEINPNMIDLAISLEPSSSSSSNYLLTSIKKEPETLDPNDQNLIKPKQSIQDPNSSEDQESDQKKIKTSITELQSDDSELGDHKCIACKLTFASGNALGGHMSSHAKKRKREAMKNGGQSIPRADVDGPFQEEKEDIRGALTSESVASTVGEKIDGNKPSSQVDNDDDKRSTKTDADADNDMEEEDESSSPPKVA